MVNIFGSKKNKEGGTEEASVVESKTIVSPQRDIDRLSNILRSKSVLLNPRITEKASDMQMSNNVYTFDVMNDANKVEVAKAIKDLYGVTPIKMRMVKVPSKTVRTRKGGKGVKSGGKKAYIYLKKGDSIEFV